MRILARAAPLAALAAHLPLPAPGEERAEALRL